MIDSTVPACISEEASASKLPAGSTSSEPRSALAASRRSAGSGAAPRRWARGRSAVPAEQLGEPGLGADLEDLVEPRHAQVAVRRRACAGPAWASRRARRAATVVLPSPCPALVMSEHVRVRSRRQRELESPPRASGSSPCSARAVARVMRRPAYGMPASTGRFEQLAEFALVAHAGRQLLAPERHEHREEQRREQRDHRVAQGPRRAGARRARSAG